MPAKHTNGPRARAGCIVKTQTQGEGSVSLVESQPINPANLAAERVVLSAVLEDDDGLLQEVIDSGLVPEDFLLSDHGRVFRAMLALRARDCPVDCVSVVEELGNTNDDYLLMSRLVYGVIIHHDRARVARAHFDGGCASVPGSPDMLPEISRSGARESGEH